jgi:hypothetical protein
MQHAFPGREVMPEAPCHKILWHVKKSLASLNKNTLEGQIRYSLCLFFLLATK